MISDKLVDLAEKRIGLMQQIVVPHPALIDAHRCMDTLIANARHNPDGEKKCMALIAPPASGKSTILRDYVHKKNTPEHLAGGRIPVLHVTLKVSPSKKGVPKDILYKISELTNLDTNPENGSETVLLERCNRFLRQAGTQILIIDEFHHILSSDSDKIANAVAETIKWMLIAGPCPIVVSGIEDAWQPFKANKQLIRRSIPSVNLGKLAVTNDDDREIFFKFFGYYFKEIDDRRIFGKIRHLMSEEFMCMFMTASDGIFGAGCTLLQEAVRVMTWDGRDEISQEDISAACDRIVLSESCKANPFKNGSRSMSVAA